MEGWWRILFIDHARQKSFSPSHSHRRLERRRGPGHGARRHHQPFRSPHPQHSSPPPARSAALPPRTVPPPSLGRLSRPPPHARHRRMAPYLWCLPHRRPERRGKMEARMPVAPPSRGNAAATTGASSSATAASTAATAAAVGRRGRVVRGGGDGGGGAARGPQHSRDGGRGGSRGRCRTTAAAGPSVVGRGAVEVPPPTPRIAPPSASKGPPRPLPQCHGDEVLLDRPPPPAAPSPRRRPGGCPAG